MPGVMAVKLRLDLGGLLGRLDVVFHLLFEGRVRIGRQPLRPQRVLDHVLDDPVGREELGGRRNVFRLHHLADDLVFLLRDVELVDPADDLDLLPRRSRRRPLPAGGSSELGVQQVGGQQQFGFVADVLEEEGHGLVERVALGLEEQAIELFIPGAVELQLHHTARSRPGRSKSAAWLRISGRPCPSGWLRTR